MSTVLPTGTQNGVHAADGLPQPEAPTSSVWARPAVEVRVGPSQPASPVTPTQPSNQPPATQTSGDAAPNQSTGWVSTAWGPAPAWGQTQAPEPAASTVQASQPSYQQGQQAYPFGPPSYPPGQPPYPQVQPSYPPGQPPYPQGETGFTPEPPAQPQAQASAVTTTSAYPQQASMYPQAQLAYPMSQPSMYPQVVAPIPAVAPATAQPSTPQPLPAPTVAGPVKRSSTANRLVNGLLVLSLVAAAGGVGYAVGRQTAPAQSTANGFPNLNGFSGFGDGSGTTGNGTTGNGTTGNGTTGNGTTGNGTTGNGTTGNGTTGTTGNTGQVAAPSGAPAIPDSTTAPGTGQQPSASAAPGGGTGQQGGGFPGLGAGLTGTVTAVADGTVSYTTADGQTVQVATTADTTYHQQQAATAADMTPGTTVRITTAGGFGGDLPGQGTGQAPTASGAPGGFPGSGANGLSLTASNVEIVPATDATTTQGGGRGFGRGGLTGTVTAIADGSISISTADGQTLDVTTDADTTWTSQADATADAVVPGVSIRITTAGGFGRGQNTDASTPQTATDIEVLLPTAS